MSRVTLEMGEARELAWSFMHHRRVKGVDEARAWLHRALQVSMRRYGGAEALVRIKEYMSVVKREEMLL